MLAHIGDYPLGWWRGWHARPLSCVRVHFEAASVGCYLPICRGVTHQSPAASKLPQAREAKSCCRGIFLSWILLCNLICVLLPWQTGCHLKAEISKYFWRQKRRRQVWDESHLEVGCYPVKLNLVPRSAPRPPCLPASQQASSNR